MTTATELPSDSGRRPSGARPATPPKRSSVRVATRTAAASLRLAFESDPGRLMVILAGEAVTAAAKVMQLLVTEQAVEAVLSGDLRRSQMRRLLIVGATGFVYAAGQSVTMGLQVPLARAVGSRAEGRVLDVALAVELAQLEDPDFQDRLQHALQACNSHSAVIRGAIAVPSALLGLVPSLAVMGATDWALVPLGIVGAIPQWLVGRWTDDPTMFRERGSEAARARMALRAQMTGAAGGHELRAFDAGPFLRQLHDELNDESLRAELTMVRQNVLKSIARGLGSRAAAAPVAGRLILRATRRESTPGDAIAGGLAAQRLTVGLHRVVAVMSTLRRSTAQLDDYTRFVRDLHARKEHTPVQLGFTRIRVDDVRFTYPGSPSPVLDGVTLHIDQGEVVALVGENGCGKTTLAKVLCALYRPTAGSIWWDDVDVGQLDPATVRANVGVVFQNFVQYPTLTASQNIAIGRRELADSQSAIVQAAKQAGAHDFISALPNGYATVLSRPFGGQDLSTGQWQRIALARAFLRDAPLVVLDEPTAALDPRAERDLFATVASLYRNRSALLISHRLSSVRFADRICVLANGRIEESGTHDELLAANGTYAQLFELQARSYR